MELNKAVRKFLDQQKSIDKDRMIRYWIDLAQFDAYINTCSSCSPSQMTDATPDNVQKFLEYIWIQENQKVKIITRLMESLKAFDQYCLEQNWLTNSMMNGVTFPNGTHSSEVKPLQLTFKLLATSGMRRQEIVDLKMASTRSGDWYFTRFWQREKRTAHSPSSHCNTLIEGI